MFQVGLNILVILSNLYCLMAGVFVRKLRKLDYFLALFQCAIDFSFTGVFCMVFNVQLARFYFELGCLSDQRVHTIDRLYSGTYNFWDQPQWLKLVHLIM